MVFIKEWHAESPGRVLEAFNSKEEGITSQQAQARQAKFGLNTNPRGEVISSTKIFFNQFKSFVSILLIVALVFSYFFGQQKQGFFIDTIIILIVLLLKIIVGFLYEVKYFSFFKNIQENLFFTATVKRDGKKEFVDREKLVPGDIIYIKEGDIVPADARIIESESLRVDESLIEDGKSDTLKSSAKVSKKSKPNNRKSMVYSGTTVLNGKAKAVVVKTGKDALLFSSLAKKSDFFKQETGLQKKAKHLSELGIIFALIFCSIVFIVLITAKDNLINSLMHLLTLSAAVVPEGAMAITSISIAFSVSYLFNKNTLVKNPSAIENLACIDVICTNKTGTLTIGEKTVRKIYANGETIDVSGHGYDPVGNFTDSRNRKKNKRGLFQIFCCSILCNNSELKKDESGWFVEGNGTEGALQVLSKKGGIEKEQLEKEMPRIKENPFNSEKKLMSTVHKFGKKELVYAKGAPEILLEKCSKIYINGVVKKLNQNEKQKVLEHNSYFGEQGFRVLALSYKVRDKKDDEENLIFLGLVGLIDPPKEELAFLIEKCKVAGIGVKLITNDSKETATSVAKSLGIGHYALTGKEIEKAGEDLNYMVEAVNVFARIMPEQKLKVVRALKNAGYTVAFLGDNVRETKAIEFSDVGFAKGQKGTDAAQASSDVIISDDSFDSIVNAIEGGRGGFENIKNSATYIFASSFGIILTVIIGLVIALFFSEGFPLMIFEPVHLVLLFLFSGVILLPGLCAKKSPSYVMNEKPRKKSEKILDKSNVFDITLIGIITSVGTLIAAKAGLGDSVYHSSTLAFATLVFFLAFNMLSLKQPRHSIFNDFFSDVKPLFLVVASVILLAVMVYFPGFSEKLFFTPFELFDWVIVILISISALVVMELKKFILRIFLKEVPFEKKAASD